MTAAASDAAEERERFTRLLSEAARVSRTIRFWWRDDDAVSVTPQLETLLSLARRFDLPLGLAVIPAGATPALAERLAAEPRVHVLQHGWSHANHNPPGEKKMELGDDRPPPRVLAELAAGFTRLDSLFGTRFLPVLVAPWNRIGAGVRAGLPALGLRGLSVYGPAAPGEPPAVNTHLDIFDWGSARGPKAGGAAYAILCREVERRLAGDDEPIGILTHHLIHEAESWAFLKELFGLVAAHPAVEWPPIPALFGLARSSPLPEGEGVGEARRVRGYPARRTRR